MSKPNDINDVVDAIVRVVNRWIDTTTPITADVTSGDLVINVASSRRFNIGDEVVIEVSSGEGETNLIIDDILSDTEIKFSTPVENNWLVSDGIVLHKLINGMYIQSVAGYEKEVYSLKELPAVAVIPSDEESDWLTIDSTRERSNITVKVMAFASNVEDAQRFVRKMAKVIQNGLKRNLYILINDYETTEIIADVVRGDTYIKVADSSIFESDLSGDIYTDPNTGETYRLSDVRLIIEDRWKSEEVRVRKIIDANTIQVLPSICQEFLVANNAIAIQPKRFVYNSWPSKIAYGKEFKGSLVEVATISWFAEEQNIVDFRNNDPHLK